MVFLYSRALDRAITPSPDNVESLLVISSVIVRFSFAFGLYPTWRAEAIWWSSVASGSVSMVLSFAYYFHGGWRKKRLESGLAPAVLPNPEPV